MAKKYTYEYDNYDDMFDDEEAEYEKETLEENDIEDYIDDEEVEDDIDEEDENEDEYEEIEEKGIDKETQILADELEKTDAFKNNEEIFRRYHYDKSLTQYEKEQMLNDLASANIKTIYYVVNRLRHFDKMVSLDEMVSAGLVGYAKAIDKYDPSRNVKFATFAINCIKNEISFCLRKERKHYDNNKSSSCVRFRDKNGNDLLIEDTLKDSKPTPEESMQQKSLRKLIFENLELLTPLEKYVVIYRFGLDRGIVLTQKQIANIVDMSQANISKIERNCTDKLRDLMMPEYS